MEGNLSDPLKFGSGLPADRARQRSTEIFFNDGRRDHKRFHIFPVTSRIFPTNAARPARRRGDREQEVVELNSKVPVRAERNKKQESLEAKVDPYTCPTLKLP